LHAGVYIAALKYDLPGLQAVASTKFCHSTKELADTALFNSSVDLTEMEELIIATQIIYDGTLQRSDVLRTNLLETVWPLVTHLKESDSRHTLVDQIMRAPDFAAEMLYQSAKAVAITAERDRSGILVQCPPCRKKIIMARSSFRYRQSHARPIACPYCLRHHPAEEWTEVIDQKRSISQWFSLGWLGSLNNAT